MKTLKTFFITLVLLLTIYSCQKEEIVDETSQEMVQTNNDEINMVPFDMFRSNLINKNTPFITLIDDGTVLTSDPNGDFGFKLQSDGNFVCFNLKKGNGQLTHPVWATGTYGKPVQRIVFQSDLNIVAYGSDNTVYWNSATYTNKPGGFFFLDDGDLQVRHNTGNTAFVVYNSLLDMPQIFPQNF